MFAMNLARVGALIDRGGANTFGGCALLTLDARRLHGVRLVGTSGALDALVHGIGVGQVGSGQTDGESAFLERCCSGSGCRAVLRALDTGGVNSLGPEGASRANLAASTNAELQTRLTFLAALLGRDCLLRAGGTTAVASLAHETTLIGLVEAVATRPADT